MSATNDTAAPVTEDELAEVQDLVNGLDRTDTPEAELDRVIRRTIHLLPRLARDLRDARETIAIDADILRRAAETARIKIPWKSFAARFRTRWIDACREVDKINAHLREQHGLVTRDHQRLEARVVQAEAERDRARTVAAQAEALMQDRERLTQQVRDLTDRYDDLRTEAGKAACAPAEEREDACRMLAAALEQL